MAAQTQTQFSVEEYFKTHFEGPDPEYLDGQLVERHLGGIPHSRVQLQVGALFKTLGKDLPFYAYPELHLRVAPRRFRIADLAIFAGAEPAEDIPSRPPLVVIEILSPDDRFQDLLEKFEELRAWGVKHVWLVNPGPRKLYVYDTGGLCEVQAVTIPEHKIEIAAATVFA